VAAMAATSLYLQTLSLHFLYCISFEIQVNSKPKPGTKLKILQGQYDHESEHFRALKKGEWEILIK
jgi:hypothetical protein